MYGPINSLHASDLDAPYSRENESAVNGKPHRSWAKVGIQNTASFKRAI